MTCPNCNETLLMSDKNGVEIDYCPKCRGIWLDRGELEKIIERSGEHYSKKDHYQTDHTDKYGHKKHPHKKKDSFLSDFFDF